MMELFELLLELELFKLSPLFELVMSVSISACDILFQKKNGQTKNQNTNTAKETNEKIKLRLKIRK